MVLRFMQKDCLETDAVNLFGQLVNSPDAADVIVKRVATPYEPKDDYVIESFLHQGRLYFNEDEINVILNLANKKPTILIANLERPTILTPIEGKVAGLLAEFGSSDEILMEILFGKFNPSGKLPFEMPSSQDAVEKQLEDVPYDSEQPLYEFGYGLSY